MWAAYTEEWCFPRPLRVWKLWAVSHSAYTFSFMFSGRKPMDLFIIIFYFVFITQGVLSVKRLLVWCDRMDLFAPLEFYGPEWQNNPGWNSHFVFLTQTLWTPPFGTGSLWTCKAKIQPCVFWTSSECYNVLGDRVASGKALSPGEHRFHLKTQGKEGCILALWRF